MVAEESRGMGYEAGSTSTIWQRRNATARYRVEVWAGDVVGLFGSM